MSNQKQIKYTFRFTKEQRQKIDQKNATRSEVQLLKLSVIQSVLVSLALALINGARSARSLLTTFIFFICFYYLMNAFLRVRSRKRLEKSNV